MNRAGRFHRFTAGLLCLAMVLTKALTTMSLTAFAADADEKNNRITVSRFIFSRSTGRQPCLTVAVKDGYHKTDDFAIISNGTEVTDTGGAVITIGIKGKDAERLSNPN